MDGFHTFNTGNLKKFVQQTKKNKEPSSLKSIAAYNEKSVVKLQTKIRAFLYLKEISIKQENFFYFSDGQNFSIYELCNKLQSLKNANKVMFNRVHRLVILSLSESNKKKQFIENNQQMIKLLGTVATRIQSIFCILTHEEKQFWVSNVLKCCPYFTFVTVQPKNKISIIKIIMKRYYLFIQLVALLPNNCYFIQEVIQEVCQYQSYRQPSLEEQQILKKLPTNIAYQNIMTILSNKLITQLGNNPIFLLNALKIIINSLYFQFEFSIIETYKIDYKYIKVEGELFQQIVQEKPQWQHFMDFLNLSNRFNVSVVKWFLSLDNQQQFLQASDYVSYILKLIPLQIPLELTHENLASCFTKLSDWVKIHQICSNTLQQKILYPLLMLIHHKIFKMTDKQFIEMINKQREIFEKILKDKLIKIIYKIILITKSNQLIQQTTKICIDLLQQIYNRIFRTNIITTQIFVNEIMTQKLIFSSNNDNQINRFIKKFPFVFSLKTRIKKFKQYIQNHNDYQNYYHSMGSYPFKIEIRRGHQFEDAFYQLKNKNVKQFFNVVFFNQFGIMEKGVDAGGLTKQLINRVLKNAFKPEFEMFLQNSQKQLLPHPQKVKIQGTIWTQHYQFIGKMIGKALFQGITIGPKFCGPFLNAMIGKKNNFDDLRKIDKELYKSLTYIKTMQQDAKDLQLTFQYKDQWLNKIIDLKKGGDKIKVTNQNKQQYISLLANYKVNKLLEFQSRHIRKGLKSVIDSQLIFMFNYEQLNYLISGSGEIKISELKIYTKYHGYTENSMTIKMFWKVVEEFNNQTKSNLLLFVTSCPRPSFLGFQDLKPPFTITKANDINLLPISHTCANILELPDYQNKQILQSKLKMAINSCSGFDLA